MEIVVLEGEEIKLHIFEPRYKNLIQDCNADEKHFGIPVIYKGKFSGTGTEMQLLKIEKTYDGGEMDIVCKGISRFEMLEVYASEDAGIAATALVEDIPFVSNDDKELHLRLFDLLEELYRIAAAEDPHLIENRDNIFRYFHKCGLGIEKELELASLQSSAERQLYLLNHLKNLLITLGEVQQMNKLVKLNGHFRKLSQSF